MRVVRSSLEGTGSLKSEAIALWGIASIVVGVLVSRLPIKASLAGMGLLVVLAIAAFSYRRAVAGFLLVLFALFDWVGYAPIYTGEVKIYLADGAIALLAIAFLRKLLAGRVDKRLFSPVVWLLLANLVYGLFAIVIGFAHGNQAADVLGDFRRLFVYPLAASSVGLFYPCQRSGARRLLYLLMLALAVIAGIAFTNVMTGRTWDPEQFAASGDLRAVGYFTGVIVLMGIGVLYGLVLTGKRRRRLLYLALGVLYAVIVASGYRMLWALAVAVPLAVSLFASHGRRPSQRMIVTTTLIVLWLIGSMAVLRSVSPQRFSLLIGKLETRVLGFDLQQNLRYYLWRTAWDRFMSSPLVGVGIGDRFQAWAINSRGGWYLSEHTVHNVLLTVLYQTGIIGGFLFSALQFCIVRRMMKWLPRIEPVARGPIAGMLAGCIAALIVGLVQPVFESPGAIVVYYVWAGLMMRLAESAASATKLCETKRPVIDVRRGICLT